MRISERRKGIRELHEILLTKDIPESCRCLPGMIKTIDFLDSDEVPHVHHSSFAQNSETNAILTSNVILVLTQDKEILQSKDIRDENSMRFLREQNMISKEVAESRICLPKMSQVLRNCTESNGSCEIPASQGLHVILESSFHAAYPK